MTKLPRAEIGIFGGSGFYDFLEKKKEISVSTPYGKPSDKIILGDYFDHKIAFLPRHGRKHNLPPHKIPYLANLFAFKKLGVTRIIAPSAAGSLQPYIKPGEFVICDQFVDRTKGRRDSFYDGPRVVHISGADPYCPELRELAIKCCKKLKIPFHEKGIVVVVNGPRFSTRAESRFFQKMGFEVINMTQYPEVILARELEICYLNISLITDFDTGLEGMQDIYPVTTEEVLKVFKKNNEKVKKLIFEIIKNLPKERKCNCREALKGAEI